MLLIGFSISFSQTLGMDGAALGGGGLDRLARRGRLGPRSRLVTSGPTIGRET